MSEKLQKVLVCVGYGFCCEIEFIIEVGCVSVDGKIVKFGDCVEVISGLKICIDGYLILVCEFVE